MKKTIKASLALALCLVICLGAVPVKAGAYNGAYGRYIDATRIHSSTSNTGYEVKFDFGPITMGGTLSYTGKLSDEEIDEEITALLGKLGKTPQQILDAQQLVDQVAKDRTLTEDDVKHILGNISEIIGADGTFDLVSGVYDALTKNEEGLQSISDIADALGKYAGDNIKDLVKDFLSEAAIKKLEEQGGTTAASILDGFFGEYQLAGLSRGDILKMVWATVMISYDEYRLDRERWARRVEAVEAVALIEGFYRTLNHNLAQRDALSANWVIKISGQRTREFYFFGVGGNKQTWDVAIMASKDISSYTTFGWRGGGYNMPFGYYNGSAAIMITHNLAPFDNMFWYLPICGMKADWLNTFLFGAAMGGKLEAHREDYTNITRTLIASKLLLYIGGGWQTQYSSNIPAVIGNRDITETIPLGAFDDEISVDSNHKLMLTWGAAGEGAAGGVALEMHADVTGNNIAMYYDQLDYVIATAMGINMEGSYSNVLSGNDWDNGIWLLMDRGAKLTIKFR